MSAVAGEAGERTRLDCGVNALFILLHLEGRPGAVDRLEAMLPVSFAAWQARRSSAPEKGTPEKGT